MLPLPGRHRKDCLAVRPLGKYRDNDVFSDQPAVELDKIYKVMGVCPQFDILWHTLTVVETLRFYCQIKGVPKDRISDAAVELAIRIGLFAMVLSTIITLDAAAANTIR